MAQNLLQVQDDLRGLPSHQIEKYLADPTSIPSGVPYFMVLTQKQENDEKMKAAQASANRDPIMPIADEQKMKAQKGLAALSMQGMMQPQVPPQQGMQMPPPGMGRPGQMPPGVQGYARGGPVTNYQLGGAGGYVGTPGFWEEQASGVRTTYVPGYGYGYMTTDDYGRPAFVPTYPNAANTGSGQTKVLGNAPDYSQTTRAIPRMDDGGEDGPFDSSLMWYGLQEPGGAVAPNALSEPSLPATPDALYSPSSPVDVSGIQSLDVNILRRNNPGGSGESGVSVNDLVNFSKNMTAEAGNLVSDVGGGFFQGAIALAEEISADPKASMYAKTAARTFLMGVEKGSTTAGGALKFLETANRLGEKNVGPAAAMAMRFLAIPFSTEEAAKNWKNLKYGNITDYEAEAYNGVTPASPVPTADDVVKSIVTGADGEELSLFNENPSLGDMVTPDGNTIPGSAMGIAAIPFGEQRKPPDTGGPAAGGYGISSITGNDIISMADQIADYTGYERDAWKNNPLYGEVLKGIDSLEAYKGNKQMLLGNIMTALGQGISEKGLAGGGIAYGARAGIEDIKNYRAENFGIDKAILGAKQSMWQASTALQQGDVEMAMQNYTNAANIIAENRKLQLAAAKAGKENTLGMKDRLDFWEAELRMIKTALYGDPMAGLVGMSDNDPRRVKYEQREREIMYFLANATGPTKTAWLESGGVSQSEAALEKQKRDAAKAGQQ